MLGMLKRHEVEILLRAGHAKTEVARLTGISLCSVKRIAQESPVVHVDDAAERAKRQIGRPSTVANFHLEIEAADDWYLQRSLDASAAFIAAVADAFDIICRAPRRWPKYLYGTR